MDITQLKLSELKAKSPTELLSFAEELEVENANSMRKQDMMFAILKELQNSCYILDADCHLPLGDDAFRLPVDVN